MNTIYDPRYQRVIDKLIEIRKSKGITQADLSKYISLDQSTISKAENGERRLDIIELYDWIECLDYSHEQFLKDVDWLKINSSVPALPISGSAKDVENGVCIDMDWQGINKQVIIEGMCAKEYLDLEAYISEIYKLLNGKSALKNREAIALALKVALYKAPSVNPSDIYHHIVYRLYLREFKKTQADRSWVRAGGEALELFIEEHYNNFFNEKYDGNIKLVWLNSEPKRSSALREIGISDDVGKSKLDIAIFGKKNGVFKIFGGIHVKASLAERVSDDVPCSEKMIAKGFSSYLLTLDAKSYPPPTGDLVNRGELGTQAAPTDKRLYVEAHGSFTACYSYNLRTSPSVEETKSGSKVYASTFEQKKDRFPLDLIEQYKTWIAQ